MKGTHNGEPGTDWHLAAGPYFFSGTPGECRGELTFVNDSDNKIKVWALMTQPPARKRKDRLLLTPTRINLAARVPPHGEVRTQAALQLSPDTEPGLYQATVLCGEHKAPLEVEVLEHRELMIAPTHLRLRGASGETLSCSLTITNLGNVPIELGDVAMIWLRERDWIGRTLVYSLRETTETETYEDFANRLLHDLREAIIAPARIRLEPTMKAALAAGMTLERTLSITLPAGLKKGRRYLGFIKINDDRIWMELYCTGSQITGTKARTRTRTRTQS